MEQHKEEMHKRGVFFFHLSGGLSPWWDYGRQRKVLVTNRHLFGKEVVSKTLTKMNEFNSIELGV